MVYRRSIGSPWTWLAHVVGAGHYINRLWVVSFGCVLWGVMTAAFSCAPSLNFWSMLVWSITGLGLALVIPNVQSVIAVRATSTLLQANPDLCRAHMCCRSQ